MTEPKQDKALDQLKVSAAPQMELFEIIESRGRQDKYSNTIELYDALPKYYWGQRREHDDLANAVISRQCTIRGQTFVVEITPAIIKKDDGKTVLIYPGQREELVEDALRKLAVDGQGHMIEGKAGVLFSLYELQKELEEMGHTYSLTEIKEAIFVCRRATLECFSGDGESMISASFFPMVGLTTKGEFMKKGADARCYVQFNPLVTESIMSLTFRQYSYRIAMDIRSPLARFIYKRMAHYWTQAHQDAPYTPSLISFLSQSPRELSPRMPENVRAMRNALDVLCNHKIVSHYDANQVRDSRDRRKVVDVNYVIYPHPDFVKQVRSANQRKRLTELRALREGLIDHDIIEDAPQP